LNDFDLNRQGRQERQGNIDMNYIRRASHFCVVLPHQPKASNLNTLGVLGVLGGSRG
jgi:hypothetical protein